MTSYLEIIPKELRIIITLYAYPENSFEIEESGIFDDILEDLIFWSMLFKQEDFGYHELEGLINFDKKEMSKHDKLSKNIQKERLLSEYLNCQSVQKSRYDITSKLKDNNWTIEFLSFPINWNVFWFNLKGDDNLIEFMWNLLDTKNMLPYVVSEMKNQENPTYILINSNQGVFIKYHDYMEYNLQFINFNKFINELLWEILYHRIKIDIHID